MSTGIPPPVLLRTFGYSRPILVALRSLRLKPFSFGYKTPTNRFSPLPHPTTFRGSSPNLELALTPLAAFRCPDVSTGLCNDRVSVRCLSVWLSVPLIDSNSNNASILIDGFDLMMLYCELL